MAELTADISTLPRFQDADGGPARGDPESGPSTFARTRSPGRGADPRVLAAYVRELFVEARNHRRPLISRWIRNYQILHNRTWGTRASWMPSPELPEIWPIMAARTGWMLDQRPIFNAVPQASPFSPHAAWQSQLALDMETALHAAWHTNGFNPQIALALWDAGLYGTGILKIVWDPNLHNGLGDISLRRVDPFTFYPDPNATSLEDANYFIEARTMSIQEVDRRFPGSFEKLAEQAWTEDSDRAPNRIDGPQPKPPISNPISIDGSLPKFAADTDRLSGTFHHRGVTVFECWLRTHSTVDEEIVHRDPETGKEERTTVTRTVDTWRCIVVAGNCVLMDEPALNLWSHGQHPYARVVDVETGEFWGQSLVELLAPAQLSINRLLAAAEHNIWLMGNPVFVEDTRAGISRQTVTNRPGQRVTLSSSAAKAEWLQPPQMHPQMAGDLIRFYKGEMENISGLSAITRGFTPNGRNSQGVMDSVQEAAFVRIRLALQNLEEALNQLGAKAASLLCEFYDEPRLVATLGPGGRKTALTIRSQHFYLPTRSGKAPMKFTVRIEAGSTLPTSRSARAQEADVLFGMGALDVEAVLEAHQWPNRHLIVERINQMQAAGMFQPPGARQRR